LKGFDAVEFNGLEASSWQTKDSVAVDSGRLWFVHWLASSPRPLYVEAVREDSHAPNRGTHVDDDDDAIQAPY